MIGYVVSGLSLVAFYVVRLCHQSSSKCGSIDGSIDTSLRWALKEFGSAIPTTKITAPAFTHAVDHLLQLYHFKVRTGQLARVTRSLMWLALIGFFMVVASVLGGILFPATGGGSAPSVVLAVPFLLFLCQLILLVITLVKAKEVERIEVLLAQQQEIYRSDWEYDEDT